MFPGLLLPWALLSLLSPNFYSFYRFFYNIFSLPIFLVCFITSIIYCLIFLRSTSSHTHTHTQVPIQALCLGAVWLGCLCVWLIFSYSTILPHARTGNHFPVCFSFWPTLHQNEVKGRVADRPLNALRCWPFRITSHVFQSIRTLASHLAPSSGHKEPQAGKIRSDLMNLIKSDLIQCGHHIPRTTLNKPFPAVKLTVLTKVIYRFDAICIKLQMVFLTELEQKNLQCVCKYKTPWRSKTILRKKIRSWQDLAPWFQTTRPATVMKTLVLAQKKNIA